MIKKKPTSVPAYLEAQPMEIRVKLESLRKTILKAAPGAEEVISYSMPGYRLNGMLVWFMAHTKHIGFYPGADGIAAFKKEIAAYKSSKGAVQFPLEEPLPLALVAKMVRYRVKRNLSKNTIIRTKKQEPRSKTT
ncbi:MAG: iron chaperone [Bacteroidia bacterium]